MSYGLVTHSQEAGGRADTAYRRLLEYLEAGDRAAVMREGRAVAFLQGEHLLLQGEHSDGLYLIETGTVESVYRGPSGRELTLAYWSEGDFVGAPCVLGTYPNEWAARAIGRVRTTHLSAAALKRLITHSPAFAIALVECLGFKGRCYSRLAQAIATHNVENRLASLLITLGEAFGIRDGNYLVLGKVKHQELANMVGATRQAVGLVLRHFQERKAIDIEPTRVVLLDIDFLRRLAG
jgi:CRP/FNR family transcriptional regulator, cyclic AMP receptor protein